MQNKNKGKDIAISLLLFTVNMLSMCALVTLFPLVILEVGIPQFVSEQFGKFLLTCAAVFILNMIVYMFLYFENRKVLFDAKKVFEIMLLLHVAVLLCIVMGQLVDVNARPLAFMAIMSTVLFGRKESIFMNTVFALLLFVMDVNILGTDVFTATAAMFMTFCAGTTAAFVANGLKTRLASVMLALVVLIPTEIIIALMEILISGKEVTYLVFAYGAVGALLSVFAYMIILPVFEIMFAELTVFRLRELTSDQAKLIKKLKKEAFGTYNHSVVVAQLAEACASEIGENAELARAVAYYHDMGKLKDPQMFTENQTDFNVHDQLTPELSADIIRSHARDGATLIKKHRLPEIFADIAVQHHGTMPIKFFYARALKMSDGELRAETYSYNGTTPRTKIAAILMIVDASEAAARSLTDRSPETVEALVRNLIEERIDLDQFAECDITMRELTIIKRTIVSQLSGVYHSRVSYPKIKISNRGK